MEILCTTDFSKHSSQALRYAINLTNLLGARLHILHVFDISKFLKTEEQIHKTEHDAWDYYENEMNKIMSGLVGQLTSAIPPVPALLEGKTVECIESYIKDKVIDLVVLGSQGRHAISNRIFGSTAVKLIKKVKVPTLVIPENYKEQKLPERLLLALDANLVENERAFMILRNIAEGLEKDVDIIHLKTKKETDFPFDPFVTVYLKDIVGEMHLLESSDIDFSLTAFVKVNRYDLLIMLRRPKGFFNNLFNAGHTIEEVSRSFAPILVLPESN